MLTRLEVSNYALIQRAVIDLNQGLTAITGETGSGKSIILGALNLVLGERADLKLIGNPENKCLIEATFQIPAYYRTWFERQNLDYSSETYLRREITPSGKSRAFINDTPVNLAVLKDLGSKLVEIHSQSENSVLGQHSFQFGVLDAFAATDGILATFRTHFRRSKEILTELQNLKEDEAKASTDLDYHRFLLDELASAGLDQIDQVSLEEEVKVLENAGDVKTQLFGAQQALDGEASTVQAIRNAIQMLDRISNVSSQYSELKKRLESCSIELDDIVGEVESLSDQVSIDPQRAEELREKLDSLYQLERKHRVEGVAALREIRNKLEATVNNTTGFAERIEALEEEHKLELDKATEHANALRKSRQQTIPTIQDVIQQRLQELSLGNASIHLSLEQSEELSENGIDEIDFLFQANPGSRLHPIGQVASGGEVSRVMLAIKAALSERMDLPTLILDEIDAGVSGEVAKLVGTLMKQVSDKLQLVSITHLPQIAGKANDHFKVWKEVENGITITDIKRLNDDERIEELAEMISGKEKSEAALQNARELLN
jgi:DNA repair protein RecN (Recombination protein N)